MRLFRMAEGEEVVYVDLEDPRLSPRPRRETLELFSKGKSTVLLDEVGRVDEWLEWARAASARVVAAWSGPVSSRPVKDVAKVSLHP